MAEGFNFTHSAAGILNMVFEAQMQGIDKNDVCYPCIIQYILFPPHAISNPILERDSASEEDTDEGKHTVTNFQNYLINNQYLNETLFLQSFRSICDCN